MADRLPFAPLDAALGAPSTKATARRFGVHPRQIYRWRKVGLSWRRADELAVTAGHHPAEIWPAEWTADLEAAS